MKKIILTAIIGLLTLSVSYAQNNPKQKAPVNPQGIMIHKQAGTHVEYADMRIKEFTPEAIAKKQTENMKVQLGLTPEQEKKVYDLNLKNAKEQLQARELIKAQRELMIKNHKEKDSVINSILTPDQKRFHELYKHINKQRTMALKGRNIQRMKMMNMRSEDVQKVRMQGQGMQGQGMQHPE